MSQVLNVVAKLSVVPLFVSLRQVLSRPPLLAGSSSNSREYCDTNTYNLEPKRVLSNYSM